MIQELQTGILDINNKYDIDFSCKQLDDIILKIIVYDKSLSADLSNYNVRLKAFKADQVPLIQDTNITIKDNVVILKADKQLTTTTGTVKAELQFINKTTLEKKSTFYLEIKVVASVLDVDGVVSTPTCTILEEIDNKLDQIEDIKLDIIEAVKVKNDLNTSRTDANNMNNTLKTTTTNADNKKKEVETVINNASNKIKEVQDSTNTASTTKKEVDSSVLQANASKQALDTSKVNADNTKKEVDAAIIVADEKIEIIKKLDPENVVEDVENLKKQVLESTYTKIETDSSLTKLESCKDSFAHNMLLRGRTLQNLVTDGIFIKKELLKPSVYSIKMHVVNNSGEKRLLFIKDRMKYNTYSSAVVLEVNANKDINFNNIKIDSTEGIGDIYLDVLNSDYKPASGVDVSQKMCLEGDWTGKEIPPYFEGIQSTGEAEGNKISILTTGKNLLNVNGELTLSYNGDGTKEYIREYDYYAYLEKGKKYTFSCETDSTSWGTIQGIDTVEAHLLKDKKIKTFFTMWSNPYTFTCQEAGKYYLRLDINKNNTTHSFWNIQVVEGTKDTSYEKYKEDKTEILTGTIPLRGLKWWLSDIIDYDKNEKTINVGKKIFDGSENLIVGNIGDNYVSFTYDKNDFAKNGVSISNKFVTGINTDVWKATIGGVALSGTFNRLFISIEKNKIETPDVAGFKKLLKTWSDAGTPLEVYYQLANPITEKLTIKDTLQAFENGYIQLDNAITPTTHLEYSTNIPSAIGGLTQVVDHNVDEITNIESTISDMDAEIGEARKDKNTLNERLEDDRTNILNTTNKLDKSKYNREAVAIDPASDLLTFPPGHFRVEGKISKLQNYPINRDWIHATVEISGFMNDDTHQGYKVIIFTTNDGDVYMNTQTWDADRWSEWKQIATIDDTGWITLPLIPPLVGYSDNVVPKYRKINNILEVRGAIKGLKTINSNTGLDFSTLPVGFRPKHTIGVVCQGSRLSQWYLTVSSSGVLNIDRYSEDGSTLKTEFNGLEWLPFQIMFSVD
ncbi:hypothetical protein FDB41_12355 [Clostridium botulinum]|nr:hypothetical protein [Clostridium botulinum]NFO54322.1 hypothetical protein [Clostridium botulinum]